MKRLNKYNKHILTGICIIITVLLLVYLLHSDILSGYDNSKFKILQQILSLAAPPVVLIVSIIGLNQLKIAKNNARMNAKRESYKLAAEQCNNYLTHIIPKINEIHEYMRENNIKSLGDATVENKGDTITISSSLNKELQGQDIFISKIVGTLNSIEAFSLFFASGVSEEAVAFSSIGHTYCRNVKKLLPIVALAEGKGYKSILIIYNMWNERLKHEEALRNKRLADSELDNIRVTSIKSLGT
ncbi:hypothetical protein [Paenibacillus apii]|uniref:hypothetical protein n=1 Tax=Paenibacillus apii TaxID=1850370 RepID=UPI00143BF03F|nr:hypothetical protein [Paenibacillus apii]NJJ38391.1 hypothetical protein [Paenibacillus apii]